MKKAEMQEMYNEMLRSGNWHYKTCEVLCEEAGVGDLWEKAEPNEVENLMEFTVWKLGLEETPMKNVKLTVTLTEEEEKTLSCLDDSLDLSDLAQLLLVKLAHGEIPCSVLRGEVNEDLTEQKISFVDWLKSEGEYKNAVESYGCELELLHCQYLDAIDHMAMDYESALEELKESIK